MSINTKIKREIWQKYYNNLYHTDCFCGCNRIILADNVILSNANLSEYDYYNIEYHKLCYKNINSRNLRSSNNSDNIKPICNICNNEIGNENIYNFCNKKNYRCKDDLDRGEVVMMDLVYKN
tara:strand:- start:14273 stop:14638 length:366 start_codon:yes stop_codon:yes gene_type:complete